MSETVDLPPKLGGRFEIRRRIGTGGTAEVFEAWDPLLKRKVAVKRLLPGTVGDAENRGRILREARAVSAVDHPSIAKVYDVLEDGDELFLVQEYVAGRSLRRRLTGRVDVTSFFRIADACLDALSAAASKGIIHCDLKPENIVLTEKGTPKILDFGLARHEIPVSPEESTQDETELSTASGHSTGGTPGYMAPEIIRGEAAGTRSDLFSLGVVFYEMLAGLNPFRKETRADTIASVLRDTPPPISDRNAAIPAPLDDFVRRLLEKAPAQRPRGADHALVILRRIRETSRDGQGPSRRTQALIAAALVLLAVIVAIRGSRPPPRADGYLMVQPFESLSPDPDVGYFATGFTEAIQIRLAGLGGIHVVESSEELGTPIIVEGTVQRADESLKITFRIVDRDEGVTVDASEVRGSIGELFDLQDRVAAEVFQTLASRYGIGGPSDEAPPNPTDDVMAYDLYLQGRGHLAGYDDPENVNRAIAAFEAALERDATFGLAHAALGEAWTRRYEVSLDTDHANLAREAAARAVQVVPDRPETHVARGRVLLATGDPSGAEASFSAAVELEADNVVAYQGLADARAARGDLAGAEVAHRQAVDAEPDHWATHYQLGRFFLIYGDTEAAIAPLERAVELTPRNTRALTNLGAAYQRLGRLDDAAATYRASVDVRPTMGAAGNLALIYKIQGKREESVAMYEEAVELSPLDPRPLGQLALGYEGIPGKESEARETWRRAITVSEELLRVNPRDARTHALIAQYYLNVDRADEARELLGRALELEPRNLEVLHVAIGVYARLGELPEAIATARRAIEGGLPIETVEQDPNYFVLHENPEYQAMIRELREDPD